MDRSLSKSAEARIKKIALRPNLPTWWTGFGYALLGFFVLYLGFSLITNPPSSTQKAAPTTSPASVTTAPEVAPATVATTPTTGTNVGSTKTTSHPTATTVPVPTIQVPPADGAGSLVAVPVPATTTAEAAATAIVTGDFSKLQLAPGATKPPARTPAFAGATSKVVGYKSHSAGSYQLVVATTTDSSNDTTDYFITVRSTPSGSWVFVSSS